MEQKSSPQVAKVTTTETPRPPVGAELQKSDSHLTGVELNPILKDAREFGYAGIDEVARRIRKGFYHQEPSGGKF